VAVEPDGEAGRYRVTRVDPTPAVIASLAAWGDARGVLIVELRAGGGSLEERYLELVGAAPDEGASA
jgi:hypothetical protein